MKTRLVLTISLCLGAAAAQAVKLNPDAMRAMQAEGDKMMQQAMQPRTFRLSTGMCLQRGEDGNVLTAACDAQSPAQIWRIDELGRVVHSGGECLAVAGEPGKPEVNVVTMVCGNGPEFLWMPNKAGQLVNSGTACLHAVGDVSQPGANVILGICEVGPAQVWQ